MNLNVKRNYGFSPCFQNTPCVRARRQMYPMPTMRAIDPPACTFNDRDDKSCGTEWESGNGFSLTLSFSLRIKVAPHRGEQHRIIIRYSVPQRRRRPPFRSLSRMRLWIFVLANPFAKKSELLEIRVGYLHAECLNCYPILMPSNVSKRKRSL